MPYTKRIVCLANSRKTSGWCIAGKELLGVGNGNWIRPVSSRPTEEISEYERMFKNGTRPQVLDIIKIPLKKHKPHYYQQENHLIDDAYYWEKEGILPWNELPNYLDTIPGELWVNKKSSSYGENDRIPESEAKNMKNSLFLIQPSTLIISVMVEGAGFNNTKRKIRAMFELNKYQYKLAVTDPEIELVFLKKEDGEYNISASKVYLCVSLGELFKGFCYKLVASILSEKSLL